MKPALEDVLRELGYVQVDAADLFPEVLPPGAPICARCATDLRLRVRGCAAVVADCPRPCRTCNVPTFGRVRLRL